jgi:hypothetical protein
MIEKGSKLTRKQQVVIVALLQSDTIRAAAQTAGIGEATIFRWLQNHDFQCAFRDTKRLVVEQAVTNLQRACGKAVETLLTIMQDADNPATARVSCAKAILDTAIKAVEIDDLASRIERLEEATQQ